MGYQRLWCLLPPFPSSLVLSSLRLQRIFAAALDGRRACGAPRRRALLEAQNEQGTLDQGTLFIGRERWPANPDQRGLRARPAGYISRAMNVVTRFAPSPSGLLHLGHAYSAMRAWDFARQRGGRFLLRIEDIDFNRCRREFETRLQEDLAWLGITWEEPVRRQSEHLEDYRAVTRRLEALGVIYPCFCTRKEILAEIARAGSAPHGMEGPVYPGICRDLSAVERAQKTAICPNFALRIDLGKALELAGGDLAWTDLEHGMAVASQSDWRSIGDAVVARKDIQTSYHVAVVTDDAFQGVTHVIRGQDLFSSTHLHVLLQRLLGLPHPVYLHHSLVRDPSGQRLAKRDEAETLASLREKGVTPAEIRTRLGLPAES